MDRRHCLRVVSGVGLALVSALAFSREVKMLPLHKSKKEWAELLTPTAYAVLFEEATEEPGTSQLLDEKREGTYVCAACHQPIFKSNAKYESGSGWPSFTKPIEGAKVAETSDTKFGMQRTEVRSAGAGSHLGHVFDDGPKPTGQRYCNNGVALQFVPRGEQLPELRS